MEEKQFDRTKLYVPVKFAYTTLFPFTRYLDKHNVEVSSSIIAEIGHSGDTVPSAKTVDFPLLHSLANISVMQ